MDFLKIDPEHVSVETDANVVINGQTLSAKSIFCNAAPVIEELMEGGEAMLTNPLYKLIIMAAEKILKAIQGKVCPPTV